MLKSINLKTIEAGKEYLLWRKEWIDEDVGGEGFRLGSVDEDGNWSTAEFSSYTDRYYHRTSEVDDETFALSLASDQVPTHFMALPSQPLSYTLQVLPKGKK